LLKAEKEEVEKIKREEAEKTKLIEEKVKRRLESEMASRKSLDDSVQYYSIVGKSRKAKRSPSPITKPLRTETSHSMSSGGNSK